MKSVKGQGKGHQKVKVKCQLTEEASNAGSHDQRLRNRKSGSHSTGFLDNRILHQFNFTAIYEPANRKKVRGKWVFLNLLDDTVLLKTLPWYIKIVALLAIIFDAIFKTHLVSWFRLQGYWLHWSHYLPLVLDRGKYEQTEKQKSWLNPKLQTLCIKFIDVFFQSIPFIPSFFHWFIHSIHLPLRSFLPFFIYSFIPSPSTSLFILSFPFHSFIQSFLHSFLSSFTHFFIPSLLLSFLHFLCSLSWFGWWLCASKSSVKRTATS